MIREGLLQQAQGWEMIESAAKAAGMGDLPGIMRQVSAQVSGSGAVKTEAPTVKVEPGTDEAQAGQSAQRVKTEPGVLQPISVKVC